FFYTRACHRSDLPSFPTRRSSDLPRVGFETVLDVGGDEVPAVERRHVLPPDALAQLERPDAVIGARRPGLRQITLEREVAGAGGDRKSTRLNSSHVKISYAVFCLK